MPGELLTKPVSWPANLPPVFEKVFGPLTVWVLVSPTRFATAGANSRSALVFLSESIAATNPLLIFVCCAAASMVVGIRTATAEETVCVESVMLAYPAETETLIAKPEFPTMFRFVLPWSVMVVCAKPAEPRALYRFVFDPAAVELVRI